MKINLNDRVKVKLTDYGKEIYRNQWISLNECYGREIVKVHDAEEDEEGYATFLLWDFMNIYGEHIRMGNINVIEPLDLIVEMENTDGE